MWVVVGKTGKAELYLGIAALLGTLSCTAVVAGDATTDQGAGGSSGAGSSSGLGSGPGVGTGAGGAGTKPDASNPGRSEMHRLNKTEYNATVADVLGTTLQPANANWRGGEIEGFDNVASVLGVDENQYGSYVDAAEDLADEVFANPALKAKIVTCAQQDDAACVKDAIAKIGLRVFRRPLRDAELTTYQKVYTGARTLGLDHDNSLKTVLWSLLSSAEFLYRIELPQGNGARTLDGFELASRLSYFLWTSAPDDALLSAAANGALSKNEDVTATVDRMLLDPKSNRFIEAFAGQWLGARKVMTHPVAAERFPDWSAEVASAATTEMYLYFSEFLRNDLPWSDFLKKDLNFVNAPLAKVYGMQNVSGTQLLPVSDTADQRAGFLGLAGFLALTSMDRRTSPTLRGKWVLGNLLCQEAPVPPKDIPDLDVGGKDLDVGNIRDILTEHRVRPDCATCHAIFDPFGLALEQFDAIGRFRTTYGDGSSIDATTALGGKTFQGMDGAADIVTSDARFTSCFAHKLFTYGLGRTPSGGDAAWIHQIEEEWSSGNLSMRSLIEGLTQSVPFRNSGDVK